MTQNRLYVVSYDIPDDRRRIKVANLLKSYGERVQYSVFECWLSRTELAALEKALKQRIEAETDSVRLYQSREAHVVILGIGTVTKNPDAWVA